MRVLHRLRLSSSVCILPQKDSIIALLEAIGDRSHRRHQPDRLARSVKAQEVNCTPWSAWTVPPEVGWRLRMAISNALTTNVASAFESIDQPTIRRLNASRTAQQYSHPSRVRCCVMSLTHNSFGASRWNLRLTRSSAVATPRSRLTRTGPGSP